MRDAGNAAGAAQRGNHPARGRCRRPARTRPGRLSWPGARGMRGRPGPGPGRARPARQSGRRRRLARRVPANGRRAGSRQRHSPHTRHPTGTVGRCSSLRHCDAGRPRHRPSSAGNRCASATRAQAPTHAPAACPGDGRPRPGPPGRGGGRAGRFRGRAGGGCRRSSPPHRRRRAAAASAPPPADARIGPGGADSPGRPPGAGGAGVPGNGCRP